MDVNRHWLTRNRKIKLSILLITLIVVALIYGIYLSMQTSLTLNYLNKHLDIGGIKLGMTEHELIELWGEGKYIYGFGGHGRKYVSKATSVSITGDSDSFLYGKVSQIQLKNPEFSIFDIHIGDDRAEALSKLRTTKFRQVDSSDELFERGEFTIAIRGGDRVTELQI